MIPGEILIWQLIIHSWQLSAKQFHSPTAQLAQSVYDTAVWKEWHWLFFSFAISDLIKSHHLRPSGSKWGQEVSLCLSSLIFPHYCFLSMPLLICCSHSLSMWKLGRAAGSRFQHCFMMLYTTSGQPSGQSILYPFSTRGTTSFSG